jgi:hypothetical protein
MDQINLPAPQTPQIPDFTIGVDLDGVSYTLRFRFDQEDAYWYVRVLDDPGENVLMGDVRVVEGALYVARPVRTPPGFLVCHDTTGQGIAPGLADLGKRALIYYVTQADLAAIGVNL